MKKPRAQMRVALIADDRMGHTRQCEAVIEAIAEARPVAVTRLAGKAWSPLRSHHARFIARALPPRLVLPLLVGGDWDKPFDLVISGSGATLSANILLKRASGARNIFVESVRGIAAGDVDCIISHDRADAGKPHHAVTSMPVRRFRALRDRRPLTALKNASLGIVIGGPGSGYGFDMAACADLFTRLKAIAAEDPSIRWVAATSPRTPANAYPAIEAFCAYTGATFIDFRSAGPGSLAPAQACDAVLVSEDSKTMVAEFVRNGVPTIVLRLGAPSRPVNNALFESLAARHDLPFIAANELTRDGLETALAGIRIDRTDIYADLRDALAGMVPELIALQARAGSGRP